MKRIYGFYGRLVTVLALGLLVGSSLPVHAQSALSGGVRGGVNVGMLGGDDVSDAAMRAHFMGGAFATYRFNEIFAIQPEVLFSEKGANVANPAAEQAGDVTYTFGYLEIPLLARVFVPTHVAIQPSFFAGPALDVKLYGDADGDDLKDQLKSTDYGVIAGFGLDYALRGFHIRERHLMFDARYMFGLTNVLDVPGDPEVRNHALTFSLGFGF